MELPESNREDDAEREHHFDDAEIILVHASIPVALRALQALERPEHAEEGLARIDDRAGRALRRDRSSLDGFDQGACASERGNRFLGDQERRGRRRAGEELRLAQGRDASPLRYGIMGAALDFDAYLRIDQGGGENSRAACWRQGGDSALRPDIQGPGGRDNPGDYGPNALIRLRRRHEHRGVDTGLTQPLSRQIDPAKPRVLADVAGDVRQLHCDPELAGASKRLRRTDAHQQGHHDPDRSSDAHSVLGQRIERFIDTPFGVPCEPFEQRFGDGARNGEAGA